MEEKKIQERAQSLGKRRKGAHQLVQNTEHNSFLSSTQHGFRPKLSTETALLQVSKKIYGAIDSREICLLTLHDLSKAFDSVSHDILLKNALK